MIDIKKIIIHPDCYHRYYKSTCNMNPSNSPAYRQSLIADDWIPEGYIVSAWPWELTMHCAWVHGASHASGLWWLPAQARFRRLWCPRKCEWHSIELNFVGSTHHNISICAWIPRPPLQYYQERQNNDPTVTGNQHFLGIYWHFQVSYLTYRDPVIMNACRHMVRFLPFKNDSAFPTKMLPIACTWPNWKD